MKTTLCFLSVTLLMVFAGCGSVTVFQPSVSMEAYRMDAELASAFIDTNPNGASFSITPVTFAHDRCTAEAHFHGFGPRKDYLLFCANTGDPGEPVSVYQLTIEDDLIIEYRNGREVQKSDFAFSVGAQPGFQSTWYLWAVDNSVRLAQKTTPRQLQAVGIDGASFRAIRKETGGNVVDIIATGLKANEQVCFVFRSMGEEFFYPRKAPDNGTLHYPLISSFVGLKQGELSGQTTILLVRESETLELAYDWDLSTTRVAAKK
jgi:hypothetical protein